LTPTHFLNTLTKSYTVLYTWYCCSTGSNHFASRVADPNFIFETNPKRRVSV